MRSNLATGPSFRGKRLFVGGTKTGERREERLAGGRNWAAVKRYNETSEQREERLAAQLDVKVQRKFQGKRRVLESQATTGTSQMNSGNKPGKGAPVVRA